MKRSQIYVSNMFCGALGLGCVLGPTGNDTQSATTSTTSTTSGTTSGAVTGAHGSTTEEITGDSTPTMAATATTSPATTTDSSSTGEACQFFGCGDMPPGWCDIFAQDCPEGQKCAAWADDGGNSWNSVHCVDVTGTDKPGESCTYDGIAVGSDSCIKGAMCWDTDAENVGTCVQQCTGSPEAPICPDGPCTVGGEVLILCFPTCDPLLQDCPGELCIPNGDNFVCVLDSSGDEGQANDPCEFANVCDAGLVCLDPATGGAGCDPAAGGCCSPFCEFPDGACPNPDQQCVQWYDPAQLPAGDPKLDIGVCGVPT